MFVAALEQVRERCVTYVYNESLTNKVNKFQHIGGIITVTLEKKNQRIQI